MRTLIYPLVFISSLALSACTSILENLPGVYSLDIRQGNIIDQEMIDQLRPKMTKRQVLYIMGSSMLVDVFHQKRWDYLYSEQPGGEPRRQKRLALFFDGDELIGIQGDFRPSTLPVIRESHETTIEVPERVLEKTIWGKITGLFSDDTPPEKISDNEGDFTSMSYDEVTEETVESVETSETSETSDDDNEVISVNPLEEEKPQNMEEIQE